MERVPGDGAIIFLKCRKCGYNTSLLVTEKQLEELLLPYQDRRNLQEIIPDVPREIREMLQTGLCDKCFKKI